MVAILGTRGSFRGWAAVPLLLLGFLGPAASSGAVETALLDGVMALQAWESAAILNTPEGAAGGPAAAAMAVANTN